MIVRSTRQDENDTLLANGANNFNAAPEQDQQISLRENKILDEATETMRDESSAVQRSEVVSRSEFIVVPGASHHSLICGVATLSSADPAERSDTVFAEILRRCWG